MNTEIDIKHGFIVMNPNETKVLHFAGYEEKPDDVDLVNLRKELKENPDFKITNVDKCIIREATKKELEYFKDDIERNITNE